MKKFLVTYHVPAEVMAQMGEPTPEEWKKGMEPWMAWSARVGDQLVDMGTPLHGGQNVRPDGAVSDSARRVTGYSILQADSMEEALRLLDGHPHLGWNPDCEVEVHECTPIPTFD